MSNEPRLETNQVGLAGDMELQTRVLEDLGGSPNYQRWLTSLARPYLGERPIELGSGTGDYAQLWLDDGVPQVTVTEIDPSRHAILAERFRHEDRVLLRELDIHAPQPANHTCLVSFNVLEHVHDDVAALAAARTVVEPGGYVVHFVPAFPFALSRFDREIGHFRRYRVAEVRRKAEQAGLDVVDVRYVNMPGLLAWFVLMRVLGRRPSPGPMLTVWDNVVVPLERMLERRVRVPFGQSVLIIARTPDGRRPAAAGG